MKRVLPFVLILICCISMPAFTQYSCRNSVLTKEFIYTPQDVQFPSCHASTIIQIKNGLIAAWFGGTAERNPDVGIWISIQSSGKWSKPVEVANGIQHKSKRYPCWNPVLYNTGDKILLYYKVGPSPSEWWGEMITSDDNGKSWSRPYRLPEDIYGPVKNKPILLKNGDLLCPSSTEDHGWRLHMEFTPDFGRTWERTAALNGKDTAAIQPSILTNNDGTLQLVCRSKSSAILTALSNDNGRTWTKLIPTGLPNPNSGIDAVTLNDGRHLIVYNHIKKGRNILNVSVSKDCKTWEAAVILENEASDDEFSYPAVIQDEEGLVHITYTWKRELIRHVVIDPARIITKPIVDGNWPE
ncbi:MAG TPA: sialidase family protein [Bacteroidales bacterium]|nr:sialidase family protein [Bacteroidales bacterium]